MNAAKILDTQFHRKKAAQPGYSVRALARDLGVSPSFASQVLTGKKRFPARLVGRAIKVLDMDGEKARELKKACLPEAIKDEAVAPNSTETQLLRDQMKNRWSEVSKDKLRALRHWYYVALLDLTTCRDYDGTARFIADRLGLAEPTVEVAMRELTELGLLTMHEGKLVKSAREIRMGSARSLTDIRRFHAQMLDKAKQVMLEQTSDADFARRLITGISVATTPDKIEIAKQMLSESLHEIAAFLADGESTEVFHLSAQLFPVSRSKNENPPNT